MTTGSITSTTVSAPHISAPTTENDGLGMDNDLCAAMTMMAMELRQPLQVIVSAHDVLARRLRGAAAREQLTMIEGAAMRLADTVCRLVEILRLQRASTLVHYETVRSTPPSQPHGAGQDCFHGGESAGEERLTAACMAPAADGRDLKSVRVRNRAFTRHPAPQAPREGPLPLSDRPCRTPR